MNEKNDDSDDTQPDNDIEVESIKNVDVKVGNK
jgi:hypothetical protein